MGIHISIPTPTFLTRCGCTSDPKSHSPTNLSASVIKFICWGCPGCPGPPGPAFGCIGLGVKNIIILSVAVGGLGVGPHEVGGGPGPQGVINWNFQETKVSHKATLACIVGFLRGVCVQGEGVTEKTLKTRRITHPPLRILLLAKSNGEFLWKLMARCFLVQSVGEDTTFLKKRL